MKTAYIGLGSNLGNSRQILRQAWEALGKHPGIKLKKLSSPYRTEPVGMESESWFINAAGSLKTSLGPQELLQALLLVEKEFGRVREPHSQGTQDRTLDLDLLLFEEHICENNKALIVPHPQIEKRLFVLYPLNEIAPQVIHPVLKRSINSLLERLLENQSRPQAVRQVEWADAGLGQRAETAS